MRKSPGWCPMVINTQAAADRRPDSRTGTSSTAGKINMWKGRSSWPDPHPRCRNPPGSSTASASARRSGVGPPTIYLCSRHHPHGPRAATRRKPCKMEYYEPPLVDGKYLAFNPRGVDYPIPMASPGVLRLRPDPAASSTGSSAPSPTARPRLGSSCAKGGKSMTHPARKWPFTSNSIISVRAG